MLSKRFQRDGDYHAEYKEFMDNVLRMGYAREVPDDVLVPEVGKAWYLPHHGVYHPRKDKLRVVFDCAARYGGTSLYEKLLSGPYLANSLVGTLLRFRHGHVAIIVDIESMFHQVYVPVADASFLRFLWWKDGDPGKSSVEYQMNVHLFGATSSPSCANFTLLKTADDNEAEFGSTVASSLRHNFFVDDCLKSVDDPEEAVQLYEGLRGICGKGGFNLTKLMCNERSVLDHIPTTQRAKEVKNLDLDQENLPIERTLGVQWNPEFDVFEISINVGEKPATRRGILSITSSIFNLLGFVFPCILRAKQILQEFCGLCLSWDDKIPQSLEERWNAWLAYVQLLSEFKVARCVKPNHFGVIQRAELYHFSDASEVGYGVASFLRVTNASGDRHCCLLMGKSRVTPLKQVTIPRPELTAVAVAVKSDAMLKRELEILIAESYFWTDSMSVLRYIYSNTARFYTFVANMVAIIREGSEMSQWRYINTKLNPADEASRGQTAQTLLQNVRWVQGPGFLSKDESEWPENPEIWPV